MESKPNIFTAIVPEQSAGERLDRWLGTLDIISSRSRASTLIDQGRVTLGGRKLKASFKVPAHAAIQIEIPPAEPTELQPLNLPLHVLHEDEDVIVVSKPAGLVVHPSAGHAQDTLVNILLHHSKDLAMGFGENRPGIVHRIDRDTSGILVVAKNDNAHRKLAEQFQEKTVHRIYWAIVNGIPSPLQGTRKSMLARHPDDRKRFASSKNGLGKLAITHYKTLKKAAACSWVECKLETGRTHQIRVHMAELGNPIWGDPVYGGKFKKEAPRLALHACELGFVHPGSGDPMFFQLPWPEDLQTFAKDLGFTK